MRQSSSRPSVLLIVLIVLIILTSLAVLWFAWPRSTANTPGDTTQEQQITIDAPEAGATVTSPVDLQGSTTVYPFEGSLIYRVFDARGNLLGTGPFQVTGDIDQPGTFNTQISYDTQTSVAGRIEVVEIDAEDGAVRAIASVPVNLQAGGAIPPEATLVPLATATLPPGTPETIRQTIIIDTPAPGTQVGSPVVITGRTTQFPFQGSLGYRVIDAGGRQLGVGTFNVNGVPDQPATFNAALTFNLPLEGGPIRLQVFDQNATTGAIIAGTTLDLQVAPTPQSITIETPAPGTQVGSPVVITGRTARFPFQGSLGYRIVGPNGSELGSGTFAVSGAPGQPSSFNPSLTFDLPPGGGTIRLELFDQNAASGAVAASAGIDLQVAPPPPPPPDATATNSPAATATNSPAATATNPPAATATNPPAATATNPPAATATPVAQSITIDSPAPGTVVGSPVVLTGRTTRYPFEGNLGYRVLDATRNELGSGGIPVTGSPGQPTTFNASLTFTEPAGGGPIVIEVFDQDAATGGMIATASLNLVVNPPATATPVPQAITIDTPAPGTAVGSPVVLTGRTTRYPFEGNLGYRVLDLTRNELGSGGISVTGSPGQPTTFNAALTFTEPAGGGRIVVEVFDQDAATGETIARASIDLVVNPPAQPQPRDEPPQTREEPPQPPAEPTAPPVVPAQTRAGQPAITIDTPAPGTVVGSPVVLTGRTTQVPAAGTLTYRVLDANGSEIGAGDIAVTGAPNQAGTFNAAITFTEPAGGGPITVTIFDPGDNDTIVAEASVELTVAPAP